jgi:hypothetical protein
VTRTASWYFFFLKKIVLEKPVHVFLRVSVSLSSLDIAILAGKEELRTEFFNEMRT